MTIQEAYQRLLLQLYELYDDRETANIADMVMEHVTGQRKIDRIMHKQLPVSEQQQLQLDEYTTRLLQHKPVQQVLQRAWFGDHAFYVNEHVLIPRPETEELVAWAAGTLKHTNNIHLLDIGAGSGCIPITLKLQLPNASITSIDVSDEALMVAKKNAAALSADVDFMLLDFLDESNWNTLPVFDAVISNPPYIRQSEERDMMPHVLQYEPHIALFVPDEDALLFYRKIAAFGLQHLQANGKIFVEINEALGRQTCELFTSSGYTAHLKKDMQGKDRMILAIRSF